MDTEADREQIVHISLDRIRVWLYLVAVPLAFLLLGVLLYFNHKSEIDRTRRQQAINTAHIKLLDNALAEVCNSNQVMSNVVSTLIFHFQTAPDAASQRTQNTINTLGFLAQSLGSHSACKDLPIQ